MDNCVFCQILEGRAPADRVLENERVVAFLDIHPSAAGHVLVVPRAHSDDLGQANDADMAALMKMARRMGERQRDRLGATGYNILMATGASAQQSVFHTHLHVVPRFDGDGLDLWIRGPGPTPEAQANARRLLTQPLV